MRSAGAPRSTFARGAIGQVGPMSFARVDHEQPLVAGPVEQRTARADGALQQRYVVAERLTEAARFEEVALHVDDDQRGAIEVELDGLGFGFDRRDAHGHASQEAGHGQEGRPPRGTGF